MRFVIEPPAGEYALAVWDDPTALTFLDRLIFRADEAAHHVVLRDADLLDNSEWFQHPRQATRDLLLELREMARASAWDAERSERTAWRVSTSAQAERALRIANSPVKVLVENRLRDGALLEVAVRLLAGEPVRQLWMKPPVPPAIEVIHSGGTGDMPKFMEHEANNAREIDIPFRLIVVVDSDRTSPEQAPSEKAIAIKQKASELGAIPFILAKHEAENYIPDFHWHAELARAPYIPVLAKAMTNILAMSAVERDYCDMDKLKCKRLRKECEQKRPYHLEVLLQRIRQESESAARNVMADDLRARDHSGDLNAILELIDQER